MGEQSRVSSWPNGKVLRYHEFVCYIRNNNPPSAYAMHILNHHTNLDFSRHYVLNNDQTKKKHVQTAGYHVVYKIINRKIY